jgi:RNA polymerase sigma-70 factor (ECF subfamily)
MGHIKEHIPDAEMMQIESFPLLVERYQHKVFHTCNVLLKNREDAEDIAQEVFVEVYRSIGNFRGEASLSTWIYRIAVNRCMDYIRMKQRKKRNLFAFSSKSHDEIDRLPVINHAHPHQILEQNEREALIQKAIDQLPERQRLAFNLAKIDGLKQDEVAQIMETTVSSIESLLIRAKKNLKEVLLKELDR